MSNEPAVTTARTLAPVSLLDAWTNFCLSRQAKNVTPATMEFYRYTAGAFLQWIERQGMTDPQEITARHVRAYLAQVQGKGKDKGSSPADPTLHANARDVRTLLRF